MPWSFIRSGVAWLASDPIACRPFPVHLVIGRREPGAFERPLHEWMEPLTGVGSGSFFRRSGLAARQTSSPKNVPDPFVCPWSRARPVNGYQWIASVRRNLFYEQTLVQTEVDAHLVVAAVFKTVGPQVNLVAGRFDSDALPPFW